MNVLLIKWTCYRCLPQSGICFTSATSHGCHNNVLLVFNLLITDWICIHSQKAHLDRILLLVCFTFSIWIRWLLTDTILQFSLIVIIIIITRNTLTFCMTCIASVRAQYHWYTKTVIQYWWVNYVTFGVFCICELGWWLNKVPISCVVCVCKLSS